MARKITIAGVEFELAQAGLYVRFGDGGKPDVMITRYDDHLYDINIHQPGTGEILDSKFNCQTKEICVVWAKQQGYIT